MEKEPVKEELKPKKKKWINPLRDRTRVVPFVVPDKEERMAALGSLAGEKWRIKKSLLAILNDFNPIKVPQPGDNLFENEQEGQGFGLFASKLRNHIDIEKEVIYIATFFSKVSEATIKRIKKKAKAFFIGIKVKLFEFPKTNLNNFDPMQGPNGQKYYDAAKINEYFAKHLPKNTYSVAILSNLLIYNGDNPKELLEEKWIFGLGSIKDRTSLISFEQIILKDLGGKRQEGEEDESEKNVQFLIKVVNHELCHTFGMRHCIYYECLMKGSNHYEEAIDKEEHLCPICLRKLQSAIQFDFVQRFMALGDEKSLLLAEKIRQVFNIQK